MTFFLEVILKWFSYRNDIIVFDMIMINLSEMIVWPSFGAVRQGILGLQETKMGETVGKVAETANGWAMPCRAMMHSFKW